MGSGSKANVDETHLDPFKSTAKFTCIWSDSCCVHSSNEDGSSFFMIYKEIDNDYWSGLKQMGVVENEKVNQTELKLKYNE